MIISQVSRSKFNRSKPQQRLILCISICDFFASVVWLFTNFFMPPGTALFALGNEASCEAQGFFVQFILPTGFIYMCGLQLQYLLVIKYGWNAKKVRKIEHWLHALPICFGLGTASAATALDLMNPANWDCWIAPYPADCTASYVIKQGKSELTETDCIRGDNAELYRWAFFFGPLWLAIVFCMYIMFRVFRTMKKTEAKSNKWKFRKTLMAGQQRSQGRSQAPRPKSLSNEILKQSLLYTASFFAVWTFPTIARLIQVTGGEVHNVLVVLAGTFITSQGIWNAMIYFRPRYMKCEEKGFVRKVWMLVKATLFFCCTDRDYSKDNKDYVDKNDYVRGANSEMTRSDHHKARSTASDVSLPLNRRESDPENGRPLEVSFNAADDGLSPASRNGSRRVSFLGDDGDNINDEAEEKVDCDEEQVVLSSKENDSEESRTIFAHISRLSSTVLLYSSVDILNAYARCSCYIFRYHGQIR